jgi:hypothetical protein
MITCIPVEFDDDAVLFVHEPHVYTVKVEIPISATDSVVVGFNPCSTLYPEAYGRSNWYTRKKALNTCESIMDHE